MSKQTICRQGSSQVWKECWFGLASCVLPHARVRPSLRSINLSNLSARAAGIVHPRKYLVYPAPRGRERERERESVRVCGFWRLSSHRDRARRSPLLRPPSLPVAASESEDASRHWGPKTPHAREIRDIHSTPLQSFRFVFLRRSRPLVRSFVPRIHVTLHSPTLRIIRRREHVPVSPSPKRIYSAYRL